MKEKIKKIWDFLWHSDNPLSWVLDLIIIFILVKFVIFPVFSLAFSTPLPFVVIESCSLEHKITSCNFPEQPKICGNYFPKKRNINFDEYWELCGEWYENHNITKEEFKNYDFKNGLDKGDIIVVFGKKQYNVGDIIIFSRYKGKPIIHRIIKKDCNEKCIYSTKGDNNADQLSEEINIKEGNVLGKAVFRIPKLGWVKLFFFETLLSLLLS